MIRRYTDADFAAIEALINEAREPTEELSRPIVGTNPT